MPERPDPQSFVFREGEAFTLTLATTSSVSGMTPRFAARRVDRPIADNVFDTEASPASATATITDTQEVTISVNDEQTEGLSGDYEYACFVEDGSGDISEIAWGFLTFLPGVGA